MTTMSNTSPSSNPRDLLSLARTTRDFNDFLMSRRSARLSWKAAWERQVDPTLPACPPFLSEPAFANVLFSSICQVGVGMLPGTRAGPAY